MQFFFSVSLLFLVMNLLGFLPKFENNSCLVVNGTLTSWNGWPPSLRLHSNRKGLGVLDRNEWVVGIQNESVENPKIPNELKQYLPNQIQASFTICYSGSTSLPYYEDKLPLYEVIAYHHLKILY